MLQTILLTILDTGVTSITGVILLVIHGIPIGSLVLTILFLKRKQFVYACIALLIFLVSAFFIGSALNEAIQCEQVHCTESTGLTM